MKFASSPAGSYYLSSVECVIIDLFVFVFLSTRWYSLRAWSEVVWLQGLFPKILVGMYHCCTFIIFTLSLPVNATQGSQRTGLLITRSTAKPSSIWGGGTSARNGYSVTWCDRVEHVTWQPQRMKRRDLWWRIRLWPGLSYLRQSRYSTETTTKDRARTTDITGKQVHIRNSRTTWFTFRLRGIYPERCR